MLYLISLKKAFIINDERSGIPVNAGFRNAEGDLTEKEEFLNQLQTEIPSPWGSVRLDAFTHHYAKEYIQKEYVNKGMIAATGGIIRIERIQNGR